MEKKQNDNKFKNLRSGIFVIVLILAVIISDKYISSIDPVGNSTLFIKNDFEKIKLSNTNKVYDKVFYGNSVVISAFKEQDSKSGYLNIGMDYATVEDLAKILDQGLLEIGSELVIGANYLTFLDTFDTNPTYAWHRKSYEPYVYFHRDKLHDFIVNGIERKLKGESFIKDRYTNFNRYIYHGVLPDEELDKKIEKYNELYFNLDIDNYEKNFESLQWIIDYCENEDIKFRFVWFPWNNYIEKPDKVVEVEKRATEILIENNVEYIDLSNDYSREYFHDLGHLNYEFGAIGFTKEIDKWLIQD